MATLKTIVRQGQGVVLTKIELAEEGTPLDRVFQVSTLRLPEVKNFNNLLEADAYFLQELGICENDPFVQSRLGRP